MEKSISLISLTRLFHTPLVCCPGNNYCWKPTYQCRRTAFLVEHSDSIIGVKHNRDENKQHLFLNFTDSHLPILRYSAGNLLSNCLTKVSRLATSFYEQISGWKNKDCSNLLGCCRVALVKNCTIRSGDVTTQEQPNLAPFIWLKMVK